MSHVVATIAVLCGVNLVVQTNPISSALSLVGVMGALAVLYLLLGAEFMAAAQMMFMPRDHGAVRLRHHATNAGAAADVARIARCLSAGAIAFLVWSASSFRRCCQHGRWCSERSRGNGGAVGKLFTEYLLPFEVTSLLILINSGGGGAGKEGDLNAGNRSSFLVA
jgi:NADH-quinone oxidoreductase subunit J